MSFFCFAARFHPAMRHAGPTRRELGVPTAFNFLGPMANPARVGRQVLGVSDPAMAEKMAAVLAANGTRHALVVYGNSITLSGRLTRTDLGAGISGQPLTIQPRYDNGTTGTVIHTLTIPRGMTTMASGQATADARSFELRATQGLDSWGICSAPFLLYAFKTVEFRIRVTLNDDGTWGYEEDSVLMIHGQSEPFHHTDRNLLRKIAEPTANPLARYASAR